MTFACLSLTLGCVFYVVDVTLSEGGLPRAVSSAGNPSRRAPFDATAPLLTASGNPPESSCALNLPPVSSTPVSRLSQFAAIFALLATSAFAADFATLRNGFTIRHERREVLGATTRLFTDIESKNFIDVSTADIIAFEPDLTPPTPPPQPAAAPLKSIADSISDAASTHGIDPDFIASVIRSESSSNPRAVSPKGARGLMQLMPATADKLGVKNSFDPGENIDGGTRYLRELLVMYKGDAAKALAAYNAGPHRVAQYHGVPPYRETRAYVSKTIREYNRRKLAQQKQLARSVPSKPAAKAKQKTADSSTSSPRKPA
jgi:soluble lytic murein transglycosylase-like protein